MNFFNMARTYRLGYTDKEVLKDLRLRVETTDPLYFGLRKLRIRGKDLQYLPAVLFSMMDLEVLDLSPNREACLDFRLPLVPPSIGKLINLRVLMLDTNELVSIPKEICLLQSLERLSLSNNLLTFLPHGFGRLNNLISLHLANNKFDVFPVQLCDMTNIQFLDISDNLLITLPEEIEKLINLKSLILCYNRLIKLPDSLCKLVDLQCLWLGNNRLKELPRDFGKLTKLDWGYRYTSSVLENNPLLLHPPIEICRMGPIKIEEYFQDLEGVRSESTSDFEENEHFLADAVEDFDDLNQPDESNDGVLNSSTGDTTLDDSKQDHSHVVQDTLSVEDMQQVSPSRTGKRVNFVDDV